LDLTQVPLENLLQMEVASASRVARQVSDAPSAVAIVTADDIRAYGYRTLADILNSMRGLYTTYDRSFQYLGGRGFGRSGDFAGRILLMIDGYATNDNIYNQSYIDNSGLIDVELIERVEYVPGTGSSAYGNNAYFGTINIITKKGQDIGGVRLAGEAGSYGGKKGRATYGNRLENGADVVFSASWLDSDGRNLYFPEFDSPSADPNWAVNHGVARNLDYESAKRVFGKISYQGLTIEGGYVDRKKGIPTAAYGVEFNAYNQYWDSNGFLSARYDTELSPTLKSASHLYYGYYLDKGAGYYSDSGMWREHNLGQWWGMDQKFVANWFDKHTLVFGAEYRDDFTMQLKDPVASSNHSRLTASLYLQDEIALADQWRLNIGGRYDHANDAGGNFSPRIALMYSPTLATSIKASYSSAYRLPAAYEKYYTDGEQIPNTRLQPEYITTTELVLQHAFSRNFRLTGTLYRYQTRDLITDVDLTASTNQYINSGSGHTHGLELEVERQWDNGVRARGSYAHQRSIDQDGRWMINSPKNLGKLNLTFPIMQHRLRTGVEAQYVSRRVTEADRIIGGYTLTNVTFSTEKPIAGFNLTASVRNLFNRHYLAVAPGSFVQDTLEMDGRNFWLQAEYLFR
jgi:iron complex outermembrane receptor protein